MIEKSDPDYQVSFCNTDLLDQLSPSHPLIQLGEKIKWDYLEDELSGCYARKGRKGKPIRLMCGLLMLKQMNDLSDPQVAAMWVENPYWQAFCGMREFHHTLPCDPSDLTWFRKRIGSEGIEKIFSCSVALFGKRALEKRVIIDSTVQEKNITYPTDSKIRIKIITRLIKIAKRNEIKLRRT